MNRREPSRLERAGAPVADGQRPWSHQMQPNRLPSQPPKSSSLGLRLESKKAPVDIVAIDHIEEPTPNLGQKPGSAPRRKSSRFNTNFVDFPAWQSDMIWLRRIARQGLGGTSQAFMR